MAVTAAVVVLTTAMNNTAKMKTHVTVLSASTGELIQSPLNPSLLSSQK